MSRTQRRARGQRGPRIDLMQRESRERVALAVRRWVRLTKSAPQHREVIVEGALEDGTPVTVRLTIDVEASACPQCRQVGTHSQLCVQATRTPSRQEERW